MPITLLVGSGAGTSSSISHTLFVVARTKLSCVPMRVQVVSVYTSLAVVYVTVPAVAVHECMLLYKVVVDRDHNVINALQVAPQ